MKKIPKRYNPIEMKEILKIMEEGFDETRPMTSIVIALHKKNYKIVKLDDKNSY